MALAIVAVIGSTTVAIAGVTSTGVISACVNRAGQLRIIMPGAASQREGDDERPMNACGKNETLLTWSAGGTSGSTGPTGPTGATGPTGPTGGPGAPGAPGAPAVSLVGGGTPANVTAGVTWYMALYAPRMSNTESVVAQAVPATGTLSRLYADAEVDPGCFHPGGVNCDRQFWTLTVMKNGAATAVTCRITGSSFLNLIARTPCVNTSDTVHFAAGDLVSIKVEGSLFVPAPSPIHWTAAFTGD